MTAILPSDTHTTGDAGHLADHNNIVDCLAAMSGAATGGGSVTAQATLNTLAGAVTSGDYLRGNGTNVVMAALAAADMTGTVALANGGTGASTVSGARSNLGVLAKSSNLSDVSNANTSLANLVVNFAASTNFKPTNPTATASTSLVMMGLGSSVSQTTPVAFTPNVTGKVEIVVRCGVQNNTAVVLTTLGCRYGTGTAPTNGTAVTGTRFGSAVDDVVEPGGLNRVQAISWNDILALTAGTAYWFDIAILTANAADTVSPVSISINIKELPY